MKIMIVMNIMKMMLSSDIGYQVIKEVSVITFLINLI